MSNWPIAIDARMYLSGIGAYTRNLIRECHASFQLSMHGITGSGHAADLACYCDRVSISDAAIYSVHEQFSVAYAARSDRALHVPHYNVPLLYRGVLFTTIHDLTHVLDETYRRSWKHKLYAKPMLMASAKRSDHIFAVSNYTKNQIVSHLNVSPDKVTVVHNGVGTQFHPGDRAESVRVVADRFRIDTPYFLYVGNLKPHKNVETLVRAYSNLSGRCELEHALVIAGQDEQGERSLRQLAASLKVDAFFVNDSTNEEIVHLYRAADALVQPSFEEGFGLTVLEAMACGTPVVSSSAASLPEIAGDAALYFDPRRVDQLETVLEELVSSTTTQSTLRRKGMERSALFTWHDSARKHIEVYRQY